MNGNVISGSSEIGVINRINRVSSFFSGLPHHQESTFVDAIIARELSVVILQSNCAITTTRQLVPTRKRLVACPAIRIRFQKLANSFPKCCNLFPK